MRPALLSCLLIAYAPVARCKVSLDLRIDAIARTRPAFVQQGSNFGCSIASIGDIDGDGVDDLAIGASHFTATNGSSALGNLGAVYIAFMTSNDSIKQHTRISFGENGAPPLAANSFFGASVAFYRNRSIAVGSPGTAVGAVHLLHLLPNGSCNSSVLIRGRFVGNFPGNSTLISASNEGIFNGPPIRYESQFGSMVAGIGDFNNDGVPDLAVGASDADAGDGTVYLLFLSDNGTVLSYSTISSTTGGGPFLAPFSFFGSSLVSLGDLNGDGVDDLAIGAAYFTDIDNKPRTGAVFVCLMKADGTISSYSRISEFGVLHLPLIVRHLLLYTLSVILVLLGVRVLRAWSGQLRRYQWRWGSRPRHRLPPG